MKTPIGLLAATVLLALPCLAESESGAVSGYKGKFILSRSATGESVLEFHANSEFPERTKNIKFVLQYEPGVETPRRWAGSGRLFVAEGVLAIAGEDGSNRMFKFSEKAIPPSLISYKFAVTPVYGIARYSSPDVQ